MKVKFTPISDSLLPECRAFNDRLRSYGEPSFLLPEQASGNGPGPEGGISWQHFAAVDEGGAVRGGVLLMEQRGWLQQQPVSLTNIQSPLSEGTVDRAFSGVGLQMLKFLSGRNPFLYAVGMGSEQNPFARLLKAAGWTVARVPFQFAVIRPERFLREIEPLRSGNRRWLARAIAASGLGSVAMAAWHLAHRGPSMRGYALEPASRWPNQLDAVWERCREEVEFSILRDAQTVAGLYPDSQPRLKRFLLRSGGHIVGWSVGLVTPMKEDRNFGHLVVGTILDGLAPKEHLNVLLALTRSELAGMGAELIVTNQMHARWQIELRRLGFFSGPSNYLLAVSKPVAGGLQVPGAFDRAHVNRGDGDGRIHL